MTTAKANASPGTADAKAAARRFYETMNQALATADFSLLDGVLAEDAVDHNPVPGMKQGREGIKESFAAGRPAFPDMRFTVEDMIAEGDKVACRLTLRGTHRGTFQSVAASGVQISMTGIDVLRFEGGKLVERWGEFDDLSLLRQIGAKTLPA
jgi:steroid delta-isomerase-like uncharacterized protein